MKTFKEGDRVSHPNHGEGTVVDPYAGTGWVTVQFDKGDKLMTADFLLTPVPEASPSPFKIGDRVSHRLHGDGTVEDYSEYTGLYTVGIGANRVYFALEHQLRVPTPEPKFDVRVMFTDGGGLNSGPLFQQHAEAYLTQLPDWDTVESITINRVTKNA